MGLVVVGGGLWLYKHPAIGLCVLAVLVIGVIWLVRRSLSKRRRLVEGTARVLSLKEPTRFQRGQGWGWIELEVDIPGREPYMAEIHVQLPPDRKALRPGKTIKVWHDPKGRNPKNVRLKTVRGDLIPGNPSTT